MSTFIGLQNAPATIEYWRFVPTPESIKGKLVFKKQEDHRETLTKVMTTNEIHEEIVSLWLKHHYGFCKIFNNGKVKIYCNHKRMIREMGHLSCPICIK